MDGTTLIFHIIKMNMMMHYLLKISCLSFLSKESKKSLSSLIDNSSNNSCGGGLFL